MAVIYPNAGYAAAQSVDIEPTAHRLMAVVKANAIKHNQTGQYIRALEIVKTREKGVRQFHVVAGDPHASDIEFSHRIVVNGHDTGKKTRGTYILTRSRFEVT